MRRNRLAHAIRLTLYAASLSAVATAPAMAQPFVDQPAISSSADGAVSTYAIDLDGDGDIDVLSAASFDDTIAWHENDGDQNFTLRTIATNADNALAVFALDLDGDGDVDVLSASGGDDKIAWYENDGSQGFTLRTITTSAGFARSVFALDLDGDGDVDVLSASEDDDTIAWYENDGSQGFTQRTITTSAVGASSVFALDVDGDGDIDVLSTSFTDDKIAWYENDGSQNFTLRTIATNIDGARSVFAIDLDGDGDIDVLSASNNDNTIAWYENDGSQGFTLRTISANANGARSVFAIDLDHDGDIDVLSASSADDTIAWYENDGSQSFSLRTIATAAGSPRSVFAIDLDGDGDIDVLSASIFSDNIAWYENQAVREPISFPSTNTISTSADGAISSYAIDLDGDGDIDVLSASRLDGKIAWYENDGSQDFALRTITTNADFARSVFAIDLDRDGDIDVLSTSTFNAKVAWYENDGSQGFSLRTITTNTDGSPAVFAVDLDGDGDIDVLSASAFDSKIAWYENDGSQGFTLRTIATNADGATSVFAIDLDRDGDIDVLSASSFDDKVAWYENDGSQGFTLRTIATNADGAYSVLAVDLDGDGDIDVLSASANDDKIAWYENDGSQGFTPRTIATNADSARSVFAIDLDGDGDIDVLSASANDDKIAWYENDGSHGFTLRTITTDASFAISVFAIDLDRDGDIDVLSASYSDDKIAWYPNAAAAVPQPVNLSVSSNSGSEADTTIITVTATADAAVSGDQTVDLAVTGTGITGGDFSVSDTTITILDGQTSGSVTFSVLDDNLFEGPETATLTISDPSAGITLGSTTTQDIAIADNDTAPMVTAASFDVMMFAENGGMATLTVTGSNPSTTETCFDVSFSGTATFNTDFSSEDDDGASAGTQVCIAGDSVSTSGSITLTGIDDALFEADESVIAGVAGQVASTSITDSETVPMVSTLIFNPLSLSESGSSTTLILEQTGLAAAVRCYTVSFSGSAIEATDYSAGDDDAAAGTQICVAPGSTTGSITVTAIDDSLFEGDETVIASSGAGTATATIIDDEIAPVVAGLAFSPIAFDENSDTTTLTLTQSGAASTEQCFTVAYTGTATLDTDYSSTDGNATAGTQICVAAGDTSGIVLLTGIDDAVFEGDETVIATSGAGTTTATIVDDEIEPTVNALAFAPVTFDENGGTTTLTLTPSSAATIEQCFTIAYTGTATLDTDYSSTDDNAAAGTQICIAPSDTSGTAVLTGIDDATFEGDETVIAGSGNETATANLVDNDAMVVIASLTLTPMNFSENGGSATITVTQSGVTSTEQCFDINFAGSAVLGTDFISEDDSAAPGIQVCVPVDQTIGELVITAIDDSRFDGDRTIEITAGDQTVTGVIVEDEEPLPVPTLKWWGMGLLMLLLPLSLRRRLAGRTNKPV